MLNDNLDTLGMNFCHTSYIAGISTTALHTWLKSIKTITMSLTRAFKDSFETILERKCALIDISAQRVFWIWAISNFKALSSGFLFLYSSDSWGHTERQVERPCQIPLKLHPFMPGLVEECLWFWVSTFLPFREVTRKWQILKV